MGGTNKIKDKKVAYAMKYCAYAALHTLDNPINCKLLSK